MSLWRFPLVTLPSGTSHLAQRPDEFSVMRSKLFPNMGTVHAEPDKAAWHKAAGTAALPRELPETASGVGRAQRVDVDVAASAVGGKQQGFGLQRHRVGHQLAHQHGGHVGQVVSGVTRGENRRQRPI